MIFTAAERRIACLAIVVVGVAQLFRSDVERVIGVAYLFAAGFWMVSAHMHPSRYWLSIAQFVVGVVLFSRGVSALAIQNTGWSGVLIIFATWCSAGAMFMRFGWIGAQGRGREAIRG